VQSRTPPECVKTSPDVATNRSSPLLSTSPTTICMACSLTEQARNPYATVELVGVKSGDLASTAPIIA
jgi:hypothetical protein